MGLLVWLYILAKVTPQRHYITNKQEPAVSLASEVGKHSEVRGSLTIFPAFKYISIYYISIYSSIYYSK